MRLELRRPRRLGGLSSLHCLVLRERLRGGVQNGSAIYIPVSTVQLLEGDRRGVKVVYRA